MALAQWLLAIGGIWSDHPALDPARRLSVIVSDKQVCRCLRRRPSGTLFDGATNGEIGRGLPSLRNTAQDDVMTSQAALYHPTQDAMANALDRG